MGNEFNKEVGIKLFNARKNLTMTRAELGKIVNLHESTIKRYEDGEIKSLDIEKLKEFARALNIDAAYLMGWEDSKEKSTNKKDFPVIPEKFTNAIDARAYVTSHQIFGFGGFEPNKMSDEDILNFANEMIDQAELLGLKYTKNKER